VYVTAFKMIFDAAKIVIIFQPFLCFLLIFAPY